MEYVSGNIAFVGNYLPRRCGIATFTTDLCESIVSELGNSPEAMAIAITNTPGDMPILRGSSLKFVNPIFRIIPGLPIF
jgi:hypothetical protein